MVRCRTALPPLTRYGPLSCPSTLFLRCPPAPRRETSRPKGRARRGRLRSGARSLRRACARSGPGPRRSGLPAAVGLRSAYRLSLLPYFSPRQRPSVDLQALPQLVHIGQDVLGEVLVHRWRQKVRSAGMAPAGKPWTPGKGAGRPGRQRRRETCKARSAPPGFARITFPWLKMNHTPGAGQAGIRRPRAPQVDQQTAKQDGPSRSRDRPAPTRYGGCTRKGRQRRLRRVLSPAIIIAEETCKSNGFLLQS